MLKRFIKSGGRKLSTKLAKARVRSFLLLDRIQPFEIISMEQRIQRFLEQSEALRPLFGTPLATATQKISPEFDEFKNQAILNFGDNNDDNDLPKGFNRFKKRSKSARKQTGSKSGDKNEKSEKKGSPESDTKKGKEDPKKGPKEDKDQDYDENEEIYSVDELKKEIEDWKENLRKTIKDAQSDLEERTGMGKGKSNTKKDSDESEPNNKNKKRAKSSLSSFFGSFNRLDPIIPNKNKNNNNNNNNNDNQKRWLYLIGSTLSYIAAAAIFNYFTSSIDHTANKAINLSYLQFKKLLEARSIEKVVIIKHNSNLMYKYLAEVHLNAPLSELGELAQTNSGAQSQPEGSQKSYKRELIKYLPVQNPDSFVLELERLQLEMDFPSDGMVQVEVRQSKSVLELFAEKSEILVHLAGIAFYAFFFLQTYNFMRKGGFQGLNNILDVGKSKAKLFNVDKHVGVKFKDVAGCQEAKLEINEFVDFLKNPEKYKVRIDQSVLKENKRN